MAMKTADPELMRAINRFHVLDAIRRSGSISRTEICAGTDLSSTTVSAITAALLDDGLIVTRAIGGIRTLQRGRPRVMLELNPDAARVVGVRLGPRRIVFVVTDFQGDVLGELAIPTQAERQPAPALAELVEDGVRRCVAGAGLTLGAIKSVCVALPGVTEHGTGRVRRSPILRELDFPFGASLGARLGLPILVESDSNAAAVAEHWFRQCRDLDDFLVITIGHSLGLGVMHGGQLFRGVNGISLQLGDIVIGGGSGDLARLCDIASECAILGGAPDAVGPAATALGVAIGNLIIMFAPARVVVAGSALAAGDRLMRPLRAALAATAPSWLRDMTNLVVDDIDDIAWARGAAGVALRELYGAPWGTTGPVKPGTPPPGTPAPGRVARMENVDG